MQWGIESIETQSSDQWFLEKEAEWSNFVFIVMNKTSMVWYGRTQETLRRKRQSNCHVANWRSSLFCDDLKSFRADRMKGRCKRNATVDWITSECTNIWRSISRMACDKTRTTHVEMEEGLDCLSYPNHRLEVYVLLVLWIYFDFIFLCFLPVSIFEYILISSSWTDPSIELVK